MSTEILSRYIGELLSGRERPLQEYLLENPDKRDELLPLLVGALAIDRSLRGIDLLSAREECSRRRSLEELARVVAEREDLTADGALTRLMQRLRDIISRGEEG